MEEAKAITKATRFQIVKPVDSTWDELGKVLRDLSYHTTLMANKAIQLYWENHNLRLAHKAEHGKYPKDGDIYGQSFRNHVYHELRKMYPEMASSNVSQTNQFVKNRWQNDIRDIMRLKKSIPSFRLGAPVQVANQNYTLSASASEKEGSRTDYFVTVTLLSQEAAGQGRFKIIINPGDFRKKAILNHLIGGSYKKGVMQIVQKKKKWFCLISYTHEVVQPKNLDEEREMTITFYPDEDSALNWGFSFSPRQGSIPASEIVAAEKKISGLVSRRKDIQRSAGQRGHGRKRKLKAIETLAGAPANIRDTLNHKYSRRIVDIATGNRCGVINILKGGEPVSWTWADLEEKIRYKAEEVGIVILSDSDIDKEENVK